MRGRYHIWLPQPTWKVVSPMHHMGEADFILPNLVTDEGEEHFLKAILQNVFPIAGGANFYIGMCNQIPADTDLLTDISTEPTATNGYARQAITRDAIGWPTLATVNGHISLQSTTETFTASGGDFSAAFTRLFLTDQLSGTTGDLYSYSGALTTPVTVLATQSFQAKYELFMN
jgi:hypothetical protein